MKEFLSDSVFFGVAISILAYELGVFLKKKLKLAVFNPLLISIVAVIVFLVAFHIPYESYNEGAKYLSYLLTPATVCLAIPLYEQFELLKQNVAAIFAGLISGVLTSVICVLVLSLLFHFDHAQYVTLLPKSITTAIGMGISDELGGYVTITVAVIIITGIIGNVLAETICRVFKIEESVAKGIAIGSSAHALGTAKALELGEIEGAMSSLSIAVAGILTVIADFCNAVVNMGGIHDRCVIWQSKTENYSCHPNSGRKIMRNVKSQKWYFTFFFTLHIII